MIFISRIRSFLVITKDSKARFGEVKVMASYAANMRTRKAWEAKRDVVWGYGCWEKRQELVPNTQAFSSIIAEINKREANERGSRAACAALTIVNA